MPRVVRVLTIVLAACSVAALALSSVAYGRVSPRIVEGSEGDVASTPWVVALLERGVPAGDGQFCGGAVIAPQAVVTAAHCVEDAGASSVDVLAGRTRLSGSGGERITAAAVRVHPGYNAVSYRNDVAVLLLSEPTSAPAIAVAGSGEAALASAPAQVLIEGWGDVRTGGPSSDVLLQGTQVIRANSRCERSWKESLGFDKRRQFCSVGPNDGRPDTCQGDSGGPVVATGADSAPRVVGLVSFGGECGVSEPPGVYTRLSFFAGWIAQQLPAAPTPPTEPTPRPPSLKGTLRLRYARVECGLRCRVQVRISGEGSLAVSSVLIRAIGPGGRFDRTVPARRVGGRAWRSQFNLPFGTNRIFATAFDRDGKQVGNRPRLTRIIVPAR